MIVANDVNIARCYLLTHIIQRLGTPSYMVLNYQAQYFPDLVVKGMY
jgi:16S rRNA C967 or C1407 C5-methylase (RsmB/RsmF family)